MYSVLDEIEYIYNAVLTARGCVAVRVVNETTYSESNLCAETGYGGNPIPIRVCNEKWANVVYMMVYPELCNNYCRKEVASSKELREKFINDAQDARFNWIVNNKEKVFKEACRILGVDYNEADKIPYEDTCNENRVIKKTKVTKENKVESGHSIKVTEGSKEKKERDNKAKSESKGNETSEKSSGKPIHKSKTIWFGVATIISSILMNVFHIKVDPTLIMQYIGFLIIILRMVTHDRLNI